MKIFSWIAHKYFFSKPVAIIILFLLSSSIFSISFSNYFVGDDFTWLRWAADCKKVIYANGETNCQSLEQTIGEYFTNSNGFFYRPGPKLYFFIMYSLFADNQDTYHFASLLLHFLSSVAVFLLAVKFLKSKLFGFISGIIFLVLSSHAETIFWISSFGHLAASALALWGLYCFIIWKKEKKILFFLLSWFLTIASPFFHELGIIAPIIIIVYDTILEKNPYCLKITKRWYIFIFLLIIPVYLFVRYKANSHWFNGDYSYNLIKFPLNFIGNLLGYFTFIFIGNPARTIYDALRNILKTNIAVSTVLGITFAAACGSFFYAFRKAIVKAKWRSLMAAFALFLVALLPFVGLGNIAERYAYLPSAFLVIILSFVLQKIYWSFTKISTIARFSYIAFAVSLFCFWHILELQRINKDWARAGKITSKLVANFDQIHYKTKSKVGNPVFYFVNVPIRIGEAWVFPVGLSDALWFSFQRENLTVRTASKLDIALNLAQTSDSARVFEFDKQGDIKEIIIKKIPSYGL